MNPLDLIMLYGILKKHESKLGSQLLHITHMISNYCMEVGKVDVEVSMIVKNNVIAKLQAQPDRLEEKREGFI